MRQKKQIFPKTMSEVLTDDELAVCTEALGGRRLYIPKKLDTQSKNLLAIPFSARVKIIENFGGHQIQFPLNKRFMIGYYSGKGLNNNEIALKLGLGWGRVSHVLNSINIPRNSGLISGKTK